MALLKKEELFVNVSYGLKKYKKNMLVLTIRGAMFEVSPMPVSVVDNIIVDDPSKEYVIPFEMINGVCHAMIGFEKGIWEVPVEDIIKIEQKPDDYILQKIG